MIRHKIILSSFIFALLSPAPAALAQDECGPGPTVECEDANYPTGITYDSSVDLSVTKTNTGVTTLDANGVTLTGTGSASVLWDSSIDFGNSGLVGGDQTDGPVLDVLTGSGDIDLLVGNIEGEEATTTHGIRARSTGGGNIGIDTRSAGASGGVFGVGGIDATNATDGVAGIEAVSSGGNGNVEIFYGNQQFNFSQSVAGNQYGILAEVEGSGNLTIRGEQLGTSNAIKRIETVEASDSNGIAAIHATADTGSVDIYAQARGGAGSGVIVDTNGDVTFRGVAVGDQYGIDLLNVAAGTTSILNFEDVSGGGIALARAQGDGTLIVNMTTTDLGRSDLRDHKFPSLDFDFTGMADTVQVNIFNEAIWETEGTTVPDGNFEIYIREDGGFRVGEFHGAGTRPFLPFPGPNVVQFEGPDRLLVNEGIFVVGGGWAQTEARLEGVAEFRHSGRILLGAGNSGFDILREGTRGLGGLLGGSAFGGNAGDALYTNQTDSFTDDVLAVPDANWVGEGGEIWFDIDTASGLSQDNCARGGDGSLPVADCVELHGTTTSGVTHIVLADPGLFDRGRLTPGQEIALVDVSGGESAQGHFVIGPNAPNYSPFFGGSWDRGFFQYAVAYNEDTQIHSLVGMINGSAHQQAQLAATAHDLWRTSTATSLDRQADLRDRGEDENGGLWLRFANETADRDVVNVEHAGNRDWAFDNGMSRDSYAVTFGLDMLSGSVGGGAWSVGAMGGYINSDIDYDVSPNRAAINGWSLGAYAGYVAGPLWVDGAINLNEATLRQHIPGFNLNPPDTKVSNDLRSVGLQVDAGVRIDLTPAVFVEPLASLSFVQTSFDDLNVKPDDSSRPGLTMYWNDPTSFRAGLGGRLGINHDFGFLRGQIALLARVLTEADGENSIASIHNDAFPNDADFNIEDDKLDSTVMEYGLNASVRSPGDAVSGFLNLGTQQSSNFDAFTAKLGVRYQW